jgi:hypothetical protein
MQKDIIYNKYSMLSMDKTDIEKAIKTILNFEDYIGKDIADTTLSDIQDYSNYLIDQRENNLDNYIHIARYYYCTNLKEHYIKMTQYFNTIGVIENIMKRTETILGKEAKDNLLKNLELPKLGMDKTKLPSITKKFYDRLESLTDSKTCHRILAGNNHNIPKENMLKEKALYDKAPSLEVYLKERHKRFVDTLQEHKDKNTVWFEQSISQEAVDYVKSNQQLLSAELKDQSLFITKIPYSFDDYLNADSIVEKKYHACHCSFVKEAILDDTAIDFNWCYCSAGFAKFPFEVILDQDLEVTLLKSPLKGDTTCQFQIDLSSIDYKK